MSEYEGVVESGRDELVGRPAESEAGVEEVGEVDDDLSPCYADLESEGAEPGAEEDLSDVLDPDGFEEDIRPTGLRVDPLLDEGVPVRRKPGKRYSKPAVKDSRFFNPEQRLLVLDTWLRSGLPAGDFSPLVGVSKHTLYSWKKKFDELGPAGLNDAPRGSRKGSRLPEATKRAILMIKGGNPDYGCQRISDMLLRGPALPASPPAVARVLREAGYVLEDVPTRPHAPKVQRFERAKPNQLWQTDLFTFVLKRQNRRVYLVAFMDDHSRFIVGYGLHASQSAALVLEVLRSGIASYGTPEEILTDNGSQYITWRGKSAFSKECEKLGIRQIVASPRRPQTLGKVERFWGTLWRECVERSIFVDLGDARTRIGHFIDHYNFQRVHQGVDGLVPADRYFGAAPDVLRTLKDRVAANALEIARSGVPKAPFYLTGNVGGRPFAVHAEGERILLRREDGEPQEIDLAGRRPEEDEPPIAEVVPPEPVCPAGVVGAGAPEITDEEMPEPGYEEPAEPGRSFLDDRIRRIVGSLKSE